jgi:hypothetical protein
MKQKMATFKIVDVRKIPWWKRWLSMKHLEVTVELDTGERLKVESYIIDWSNWKKEVVRDVQRYIKKRQAKINPKELVGKTFDVEDWRLDSLDKT